MKNIIVALTLIFITTPVMAQINVYSECQTLAEYLPQAGVNFEPGVDVNGKPVVPADLNAAPIEMPDIMAIPLSFDLAQRLPDPPQGMRADASVGFLEIYKDGRIVFQGRDLTPQVYAICRGQTPETQDVKESGQDPAEPIGSSTIQEKEDRYN